MRWPWQARPETRQGGAGGFTNLYLESQLVRADGTQRADVSGLSALEASARFYRSAFMSAEVEGDAAGVLTPPLLGHVAQELIRRGQSLLEIVTAWAACGCCRAAYWYAVGGADPMTWAFQVTSDGPTDTETRVVLHEDVIFCRYAFDPRTPWIGQGPLQTAVRTGTLAGRLEAALGDEAGAAVAMVMPVAGKVSPGRAGRTGIRPGSDPHRPAREAEGRPGACADNRGRPRRSVVGAADRLETATARAGLYGRTGRIARRGEPVDLRGLRHPGRAGRSDGRRRQP